MNPTKREKELKICEGYDGGRPVSELAEQFGVCKVTILNIAKRHKLAIRKKADTLIHNRGHRYINDDGYVFIYTPSHPYANSKGYVREHRLAMEAKIGRYLTPRECVHHLNRIPGDNRIENLKLFSSNAEHLKFEADEAFKDDRIGRDCMFCRAPIRRKIYHNGVRESQYNAIRRRYCDWHCRSQHKRKFYEAKRSQNNHHPDSFSSDVVA
jgi:hypothetical protein